MIIKKKYIFIPQFQPCFGGSSPAFGFGCSLAIKHWQFIVRGKDGRSIFGYKLHYGCYLHRDK